MTPVFITGTGTEVGKTLIASIVVEALHADYWKPVQAGFDEGTDSERVQQLLSNTKSLIHPELYRLKMPASPHLAAAAEQKEISVHEIVTHLPDTQNQLIIEGAGGLMVPLNSKEFTLDLVKQLRAQVIIVSKNELGSINHSLLTAAVLKKENVNVIGWIFTEEYQNYQQEIADWSGFPVIASVKHLSEISKDSVLIEAKKMEPLLKNYV